MSSGDIISSTRLNPRMFMSSPSIGRQRPRLSAGPVGCCGPSAVTVALVHSNYNVSADAPPCVCEWLMAVPALISSGRGRAVFDLGPALARVGEGLDER